MFKINMQNSSSGVESPYDFLYIFFRGSLCGLPCASCSGSGQGTHTYDGTGNRLVYLCPCCHAIVCNSCEYFKNFQREGCRWCRNRIKGQLTRMSLPAKQLECYRRAEHNIKYTLPTWGEVYLNFPFHFNIRKICWTKRVENEGWKFFESLSFTLTEQHPNQFGMLISMMIKNASAKGYSSQLVVHPSCSRFLRMDPANQFVYMQTRIFVNKHGFSLFLSSALTKRCSKYSFTMGRYLLSNFAKRLSQTLGICRMFDEPRKRDR